MSNNEEPLEVIILDGANTKYEKPSPEVVDYIEQDGVLYFAFDKESQELLKTAYIKEKLTDKLVKWAKRGYK